MIGIPIHMILGQPRYVYTAYDRHGQALKRWQTFADPKHHRLTDDVLMAEIDGFHHTNVSIQTGVIDYSTVDWVTFRHLHDQLFRGPYSVGDRVIRALSTADLRALLASMLLVDVDENWLEMIREDVAYHLWRWMRMRRDIFKECITPASADEAHTLSEWSRSFLSALRELDPGDYVAAIRTSHEERRKTLASYVRRTRTEPEHVPVAAGSTESLPDVPADTEPASSDGLIPRSQVVDGKASSVLTEAEVLEICRLKCVKRLATAIPEMSKMRVQATLDDPDQISIHITLMRN